MTPYEYITDRLEDQISWYENKSQQNQKWFRWLRVLEIIFAMSIPFLVSEITNETYVLKFTVGLLAVLMAIISGVVTLYKFQENWIEYRTIAETLKHEKFLFLTKTAPYDEEDSFHALVERIEGLISKENSTWTRTPPEREHHNTKNDVH